MTSEAFAWVLKIWSHLFRRGPVEYNYPILVMLQALATTAPWGPRIAGILIFPFAKPRYKPFSVGTFFGQIPAKSPHGTLRAWHQEKLPIIWEGGQHTLWPPNNLLKLEWSLKGKNLLLQEQIFYYKSWPPTAKGGKYSWVAFSKSLPIIFVMLLDVFWQWLIYYTSGIKYPSPLPPPTLSLSQNAALPPECLLGLIIVIVIFPHLVWLDIASMFSFFSFKKMQLFLGFLGFLTFTCQMVSVSHIIWCWLV